MGARILLVEDNPANLELMRYLLSAAGHEPLLALDGAQGLKIAAEEPLDVVLCDVQLPDMDGFEVLRRMRADPLMRALPIVAVTALAMVGDRDRALAAGFDGYMAKPIEPVSFAREVESHIDAGRAGQ